MRDSGVQPTHWKALRATVQGSQTRKISLWLGSLAILFVLVWQAVHSHGNPNPLLPSTRHTAPILDIAVLVFREGLECILVLSAITANMAGARRAFRIPVAVGATIAFFATLVTWRLAIHIVDDLSGSASALAIQAATGLLAILVLLLVMNWFFHKVYWTGWISAHTEKRRQLLAEDTNQRTATRAFWGLGLLGFTSLYREGFEVVLFLQSYRLRLGDKVVIGGALIGLLLSSIVAILTFVAHRRLPYRRMLVTTGVLLGVVLLVMVGEEMQEMQLAHWLPKTDLPWLSGTIRPWMGVWFSVFPTVETLVGQAVAVIVVLGSYFLARSRSQESTLERERQTARCDS